MKKQIVPIKRASRELIESLIKIGVIYVGEDNQLHVVEKNPTQPASK